MSSHSVGSSPRSVRIEVFGRVQGIGARPAVARLAEQLELAGAVRNTLAGLAIDVQGPADKVAEFRRRLPEVLPPGGTLDRIEERPTQATGARPFTIARDDADGAVFTPVPCDVAVCRECRDETTDPAARRYEYPLTSCTCCGPRYSIIETMPFERDQTAMAQFPLCPACRTEYESTRDRRYHAQTTCCGECGPRVWLVDRAGAIIGEGPSAVTAAAAGLQAGQIVALRGLGGYQLLCDASNELAVGRLRSRKRRPAKPLAVLVASLADAERYGYCDDQERAALTDPANPIVLVRARPHTDLAPNVSPGLDTVGLLLPTTPLHALLCQRLRRPLICTSANREGEPLEYEIESAERNLADIADCWLHHDRPIIRPIDDSVVRVIAGGRVTIRLARGLAPLPLDLPPGEPHLAYGGHLKGAVAWSNGVQAALGPHVGDLDTIRSRERWKAALGSVQALYQFRPQQVLYDMHPEYYSYQVARESGVRSLAIQHHIAHTAAGMLEHRLLDRPVLGVAWDGTGYGLDGTIWGGEFFLADGRGQFHRCGHLRPFRLLGGESAVREPWRLAVALLDQSLSRDAWLRRLPANWSDRPLERLLQLSGGSHSAVAPITTSGGRLFDAAAAVILGVAEVSFEGQAAMQLESIADRRCEGSYPLTLEASEPWQLDWRPLFAALWHDHVRGVDPAVMSARFHRAIASGIAAVARQVPELPVIAAGGVFQNRLLGEYLVEQMGESRRLHLPGRIPPNDGGLAAGQLAFACRTTALSAGHSTSGAPGPTAARR